MSFSALATFALALVLAWSNAPAPPPTSTLSRLTWLAGCWADDGEEIGSGEHWLPPAGGTMLGVGRTVKNGITVSTEFMQIREDRPGHLVFIALPSGQREATFDLVKDGDKEVVFA